MKNELIGNTLLILMSGICTDILKPICQRRHRWAYSTNSKIPKTGFACPPTQQFMLGGRVRSIKMPADKYICTHIYMQARAHKNECTLSASKFRPARNFIFIR